MKKNKNILIGKMDTHGQITLAGGILHCCDLCPEGPIYIHLDPKDFIIAPRQTNDIAAWSGTVVYKEQDEGEVLLLIDLKQYAENIQVHVSEELGTQITKGDNIWIKPDLQKALAFDRHQRPVSIVSDS